MSTIGINSSCWTKEIASSVKIIKTHTTISSIKLNTITEDPKTETAVGNTHTTTEAHMNRDKTIIHQTQEVQAMKGKDMTTTHQTQKMLSMIGMVTMTTETTLTITLTHRR